MARWFDDPEQVPGFFKFERGEEQDLSQPLFRQGSTIELRFVTRYRPQSFTPQTWQAQAWKTAPLIKNIRVEYEGFDAYDVEPAAFPDLLAERPLVVHGKWRGELRGDIRLSGATGAGAYDRVIRVGDASVNEGQRALAQLWARTRLAALSDFGDDTKEEARAEITRLGLAYNLLTKYTSFVAVHDVVRNPDGTAREVDQPLPLPHGVSNSAVGGAMEVGSEPEMLPLLAALAVVLGLAALRRRWAGG